MTDIPCLNLRAGPSPLHPLRRLASAVGVGELFAKRDDLLGRLLGGNKLRKLEYILGQPVADGVDALITTGSFESNHVCLTAAVGRSLGLETAVVLMGPAGRTERTLNERILGRLQARTRVVEYVDGDATSRGSLGSRVDECVEALTRELVARGRKPFFVPPGGCCLEGTWAFVEAFGELHEQMRQHGHEAYDIFLPVGTGSTFAGLWCGAAAGGHDVHVRGISIARANPRCREETVKAMERVCPRLDVEPPGPGDLDISDEFVGGGYARHTAWADEAIALALETESLLLDHTYTGKALGGWLTLVRREPRSPRPVVFWLTGGVTGAVDYLLADRP